MIIALFPTHEKKLSFDLAKNICEFLLKQKVQVVAEDEHAELIGASPLSSIKKEKIDFLISMGGDGSILRLHHKYSSLLLAPILGINLGLVGFMADVPVNDVFQSLEDLLKGAYQIEERIMFETQCKDKITCAANDIVIHRAANPSLIELALFVDGKYFTTFLADGLILSTPNGSTAYSLSAGGPILYPSLDAFVITPICPHTISNRPIVLAGSQKIEVQYLSQHKLPIEVRIDGFDCNQMHYKDLIVAKKSQKTFNLVKLHRHDYYSTLRGKLGWSGKMP